MKPNQGQSHRAENTSIILDAMLDFDNGTGWFSDNKLIENTHACHPHTIRNIRAQLLKNKIIIYDKSLKLPNNEKAYRLTSDKKAKQLKNFYDDLAEKNFDRRNYGKFYKRFNMHIPEMFKVRDYNEGRPEYFLFPSKLYRSKICPNCLTTNLRKLKENNGPLDRTCWNCKMHFQYSNNNFAIMYMS